MSMQVMMDSRLIKRCDIKWNPLEDGDMDDVAPAKWNGPHVGCRLVEGFKTLLALPAAMGPRQFGAAWPGYVHDWADQLAQQEMTAEEKERARRAQNRTRHTPSIADVTRMEIVLDWVPTYLRGATTIRAVNAYALATALERDVRWIVRRHGGEAETWQRRNWQGLDVIASGLIRDREPVF